MADEKASTAPVEGGVAASVAPAVADTRPQPETKADELSELRQALERANRERDEALVRADNEARARAAASRQVADTHNARLSAEELALNTALASTEAKIEQLEAALEIAADAKTVAKLVREISREEVNRSDIKKSQRQLEAYKKAPPPRTPVPTGVIDDGDPRLAQFSPVIKDWIKRNPRFLTDDAFNAKVMRAHHAALGEGKQPESEDYFDYVETKVGIRSKPQEEDGDDPVLSEASTTTRSPRSTSAAAAPSRASTVTRTRTNGRAPDLTDDERQIAETEYDHLPNVADRYQAYADAREDLRKIGKIGGSR